MMQNEKIIVCSPELGISPQSNSGGEVYDREVIKALCDEGIKVICILPKNKPYLKHRNLKVYYLPISFVWPPYLFNLLIIPYLFLIYNKEKFNILRVHSPYFVGLGSLFFKLFYKKIPIIATFHHLENDLIFDFINKLTINKWDHIIVDSFFTKKEIEKKYFKIKNKITIVYAGVDQKYKRVITDELKAKYHLKDQKVLLFLGGLKPRKNVGFLLKIFKNLQLNNVKLLICGSGSLFHRLCDLSRKLKIDEDVIFTGFINEEEKAKFYNLADIFLFSSTKEGFGMPVIEAAACGIPAIASNNSSLKELVLPNKTGFLAKTNDLNDWITKIIKLLSDNNLRDDFGREACKFSQRFSWVKNAIEQIKIYRQLINK